MSTGNMSERARANLQEIGINEEVYWRYWYDLYHMNMVACNPQSKAVLIKYANMPAKWREKFLMGSLNINNK